MGAVVKTSKRRRVFGKAGRLAWLTWQGQCGKGFLRPEAPLRGPDRSFFLQGLFQAKHLSPSRLCCRLVATSTARTWGGSVGSQSGGGTRGATPLERLFPGALKTRKRRRSSTPLAPLLLQAGSCRSREPGPQCSDSDTAQLPSAQPCSSGRLAVCTCSLGPPGPLSGSSESRTPNLTTRRVRSLSCPGGILVKCCSQQWP